MRLTIAALDRPGCSHLAFLRPGHTHEAKEASAIGHDASKYILCLL
jgi:hypothetical protein